MQQIADWLEKLGMSEYAQRFAENDIDFMVQLEGRYAKIYITAAGPSQISRSTRSGCGDVTQGVNRPQAFA